MRAQAMFAGLAVLLGVLAPEPAAAQGVASFRGRLINSVSGMTVAGATVRIDELRRETVTAEDGTFTFENVVPGSYHLSVRSEGYSSRRSEITVGAASGAQIDVTVDPELHYHEMVSVSPGRAASSRSPADGRPRGTGAHQAARDVLGATSRASRVLRPASDPPSRR
jgi:hypothetical protein